MVKNLTIMQKCGAVLTAVVLSGSLLGCASNDKKEEISSSVSIEQIKDANKSESSSTLTSKEEASSAVETAIEVMIEGAEELSVRSEEVKQTEAYQKTKEEAVENFDDLLGFLFRDEEIAGYTIHDVKDSTVEFAEDSLYDLDGYIERNVPDYKDKLKEKLNKAEDWLEDKGTDLAARGYDKYQELKEKTLEKIKK